MLGVVIAAVLARMLSHMRQQPGDITSRAPSVRNYTEGILALARNSNLLVLALVSGIRSMTQTGLSTFLPLYLVYELKLPASVVGLYLGLVQASGMVATPIAGTLSDRYGLLSVFYFVAGSILVANLVTLTVPDLRRPASVSEASGRGSEA